MLNADASNQFDLSNNGFDDYCRSWSRECSSSLFSCLGRIVSTASNLRLESLQTAICPAHSPSIRPTVAKPSEWTISIFTSWPSGNRASCPVNSVSMNGLSQRNCESCNTLRPGTQIIFIQTLDGTNWQGASKFRKSAGRPFPA